MRGRILVAKRSRAARKGEEFISGYTFPPHVERRVRRKLPQLDDAGWTLVERGLREWFVCCAWRGRTVLGMPSRAVDEAWHEFILDSLSYTEFCERAFGDYLHHTPDEAMTTPMGSALDDTVRAWDRSGLGRAGESVLWDLDLRLGIDDPLGIGSLRLINARTISPYRSDHSWAYAPSGLWGGGGDGSGHHHHHGGGCAAGGGEGSGCGGGGGSCSGGGCGGGCGGGGCGGGGS
jgi:hypothetical protein